MPRSKRKDASAVFFTHPKPLSVETRNRLGAILGYDSKSLKAAETPGYRVVSRREGAPLQLLKDPDYVETHRDPFQAFRDVELAIALVVEGAKHLDNMPRPADYVREFSQAKRSTIALLQLLNGWTEFYRDQFATRGQNLASIENALGVLLGVSGDVLAEMKGKSSKGARKNTALCNAIQVLRRAFRDHYIGSSRKFRVAETAFVRAALGFGRLIRADYEGLEKLMRDPRCAIDPSGEK